MSDAMVERNRDWMLGQLRGPSLERPRVFVLGCIEMQVPAGLREVAHVLAYANLANVAGCDVGFLAALEYAVDVHAATDVIVCGHDDCDAVCRAIDAGATALQGGALHAIRADRGFGRSGAVGAEGAWIARRCERNVALQVLEVGRSPIVRAAWDRRQPLAVAGWIVSSSDGRLNAVGSAVRDPIDVMMLADRLDAAAARFAVS